MQAEPTIAALAAVIRRQDAPERMHDDLAAFLRAQGVDAADLDAMVAVGTERMLVYRALVHNRIKNAVRDFIGRTAARLGRERFSADVGRFIDERAAVSPYLRDVPAEFVAWVGPHWCSDPSLPPYLLDLARHELLEMDVRNDPSGGEAPTGLPLALDKPLRFDGAARRVDHGWAVHLLPTAVDDRTEPEHRPTSLLVYRDGEHKTRYLDLIPFAAALVDALMIERLAVQPAIARACAAIGEPIDDALLGRAAVLLADLADRGVMLGAEP